MIDITNIFNAKELKDWEDTILDWGVDYGGITSKNIEEFTSGLNEAFEKELRGGLLDEETVLFWVDKYKIEIDKTVKENEKREKAEEKEREKVETQKKKFAELRSQGKSVKTILKTLNLSLETFTDWLEKDLEFQDAINNENNLRIDELQSKYPITKTQRIEFIGGVLNDLTTELKKRTLEDVPTDKLLDYSLKYVNLLNTEKTDLNIIVTKKDYLGNKINNYTV